MTVLRDRALALWQGLLDAGVYTNLMIPPATPAGLSLVRISLSAAHSVADLDLIIAALAAQAHESVLESTTAVDAGTF